jgi:hypothetical protein
MKHLVKEIAKIEGLKSQVKIGNVREINKVTAAIIVASFALKDTTFVDERHAYESKMLNKAMKKLAKKSLSFDELVKYLLGRK